LTILAERTAVREIEIQCNTVSSVFPR